MSDKINNSSTIKITRQFAEQLIGLKAKVQVYPTNNSDFNITIRIKEVSDYGLDQLGLVEPE